MKKALLLLAGFALASTFAGVAAGRMPRPEMMNKAGSVRLSIVHVQQGCHLWSKGKLRAATMQLTLRRGATITVVNNDVDMHVLAQLTGPKLAVAGKMLTMHPISIRFTKAGLYRFMTKPTEMAGMPEVETTGPDHVLRLTVRVT